LVQVSKIIINWLTNQSQEIRKTADKNLYLGLINRPLRTYLKQTAAGQSSENGWIMGWG
jgi:hypothetical protein